MSLAFCPWLDAVRLVFSAVADVRGGVLLRLRGLSRWVSSGRGERVGVVVVVIVVVDWVRNLMTYQVQWMCRSAVIVREVVMVVEIESGAAVVQALVETGMHASP